MVLQGTDKSLAESEANILIKIDPSEGTYNLRIKANQNTNNTLYTMLLKKEEEVKNQIFQLKLKKNQWTEFKLIYSPTKPAIFQLLPI